jgi:hypothetical protein
VLHDKIFQFQLIIDIVNFVVLVNVLILILDGNENTNLEDYICIPVYSIASI